jgi:hypothetical protein
MALLALLDAYAGYTNCQCLLRWLAMFLYILALYAAPLCWLCWLAAYPGYAACMALLAMEANLTGHDLWI